MKAMKGGVTKRDTSAAREQKKAKNADSREQNRAALGAALAELERLVQVKDGDLSGIEGGVSVAEVCRRAGLHPGTINKSGYKDLRDPFNARIAALKAPTVVASPKKKRRPADERAMAWKAQFEATVEQLRITEVDLLLKDVHIEEALARDVSLPAQDNVVRLQL